MHLDFQKKYKFICNHILFYKTLKNNFYLRPGIIKTDTIITLSS